MGLFERSRDIRADENMQYARLEESIDLLSTNPELQSKIAIAQTDLGGYTLKIINQEGTNA